MNDTCGRDGQKSAMVYDLARDPFGWKTYVPLTLFGHVLGKADMVLSVFGTRFRMGAIHLVC